MRVSLRWSGRRSAPLALCIPLVCSSCVTNPATGERQLMLVSEGQEIAMGREADPQIVAAYGEYPDAALAEYVADLGRRLAGVSERPGLPWTFRVLDDPTVNAFALPGGFNYVTRGILATMNSEAEVASVMGHEIGHVTARHSASQMSQQTLAQVGLVAGVVLVPEFGNFAGAAQSGLGLLFLKFGRDDERQADDLGLRYMHRAGYDPREMPGVFRMLQRVSEASGGGRVPAWLSTHPDPADRQERLQRRIAALPQDFSQALVRRNEYLRRMDGLVYGANPREGFLEGQRFLHPDLAFEITFPDGWRVVNQKRAILAQSEGQDAMMELSLVDASSPDEAVRAFAAQEGMTAGPVRRQTVGGLSAAEADFATTVGETPVRGYVAVVAHGGDLYQLVGYAVRARWSSYQSAVLGAVQSFRRLTDGAALAVQPSRLAVVELRSGMTLARFAERFPSPVPLEALALLNGAEPATPLRAGDLVKRVVGGR